MIFGLDNMNITFDQLSLPDGATIAYRRIPGAGPGVIFLGGYMSDMTGSKATMLERWAQERGQAFLRFDYQGHGASSGRFEDGSLGLWTADALAVLDRLTEGPQILVGSSMGTWVMLLMARQRPQRIAALLGVASAADFSETMLWQEFDQAAREKLRRDGVVYLPDDPDKSHGVTLKFLEEARRHLLLDGPILPITCPVRLLHGMQDASVSWQTSIRVAEQLASDDVRVVLVKDGEHGMSRDRDLALLRELLEELIKNTAPVLP